MINGGNMKKLILVIVILYLGYITVTNHISFTKDKLIDINRDMSFYQDLVDQEVRYLKSLQLSDGAIMMNEFENGKARIVPYFSNLAAYAMAKSKNTDYEIKQYIKWYISKLNNENEDPYQIAGTIFDYTIYEEGMAYENKYTYDSVDSYAATFIMVVSEYYQNTQDKDFILSIENELELVYRALMSMEDNNLFITSFNRSVKYLMDNCEVVYALEKYQELVTDLLVKEGSFDYSARSENLKAIIKSAKYQIHYELYDFDNEVFDIGYDKEGNKLKFKEYGNFYPDMTAQFFPVIFDIIDPESLEAVITYNKHQEFYNLNMESARENGDTSFYWMIQALFYSKMDKENQLKEYLNDYQTNYATNHTYPMYNAEVAWVILACEHQIEKYEKEKEKIDPFSIIRKFFME